MSLKPRKIDFDQKWAELKETVKGVITLGQVPRVVWNDRFSDLYSICVAHPEPLADRLYEETKKFLEDHVRTLLERVQSHGDENLLTAYFDAWTEYSQGIGYLHKLYQYLNNQHVKKMKISDAEIAYGDGTLTAQMQEIGELGLDLWKSIMILTLKDGLLKLLLNVINLDRLGEFTQLPPSVVHGVIHSFVLVEEHKKKDSLRLYIELFETPFLLATSEFYRNDASNLLDKNTISQYMEKAIQRIQSENVRSRKFVHPSSYTKVTKECENRLVADHLTVLHGECQQMVDDERSVDLANLYIILKSVTQGIPPLVAKMQSHIQQKGLESIINLKGDTIHISFVENLLSVHSHFITLIADLFKNDLLFLGALDKACSYVVNYKLVNNQPCKSPELLSRYCDNHLKKSNRSLTENEVDDKLAQSITIFKYIDDKDVFQKFYSRMLAKRLIHQMSHSMDMEESMINRLKQACGYEFTNKLHRMFTDITLSGDLNTKYQSFLESQETQLGISFSIHVLQAGAWPLGQSSLNKFSLPQELVKSVVSFETFYHKQFNGRKLSWLHHLCQAELRFGYLKSPYRVTMQTFQMAILLHFESVDQYHYLELQNATQLADDQFHKTLISLIDSKLLLSPGELTTNSVISLNKDYTNKRTKFRITAVTQKETAQETEQTHNSVDEDRKMYLQATIVRIMKSRKVLKHTQLVQEVLSQSKNRFAPPIPMIKKCIESLIDKQYLERTNQSTDEYSYVA